MRQLKIISKITDRVSSKSFNHYLSDVRSIKSFENANEEYDCALKAFNGDERAIDELVTRNLKFVISVAKQYSNSKTPLEELVTEGNYGLIEAAKRFDPTRGFKFISYAVWYIRKNIIDHINKHSELIRIPPNKLSKLTKLRKEMDNLEQINNRPTTVNDLLNYEDSEYNLNDLNLLININSINTISLDSPVGRDEDSGSMVDIIQDKNVDDTDHIVNKNDFANIINLLMGKLSNKERVIITYTYGLNGVEPLTLEELGQKLGMSREGVRQVREKSLKFLRLKMRNRKLRSEFI
jgi:RNA polymerase primary sigma factor